MQQIILAYVAAIVGFVGYNEAANFERRHAQRPGGVPPWAWGALCLVFGPLAAAVLLVAERKTSVPVTRSILSPSAPQPQWSQQQPSIPVQQQARPQPPHAPGAAALDPADSATGRARPRRAGLPAPSNTRPTPTRCTCSAFPRCNRPRRPRRADGRVRNTFSVLPAIPAEPTSCREPTSHTRAAASTPGAPDIAARPRVRSPACSP